MTRPSCFHKPAALAACLSMGLSVSSHAQSNPVTSAGPVCSNIIIPEQHPLLGLSDFLQREIRNAVKPDVLAAIHDPGMGLETKWSDVQLDATKVNKSEGDNGLYVVYWRDKIFGSNGWMWIVEVTAGGTRNLSRSHLASIPSAKGFGFGILPSSSDQYPDIVIGSKGYKPSGGAEAEATCLHKVNDLYEWQSCPAHCKENLNSR